MGRITQMPDIARQPVAAGFERGAACAQLLELGAEPAEVEADDGKARVSATMDGERLVVTARGDKGERTTTYSADGERMTVAVTMTGSRLAGPLQWASTYVRME